LRDGQVPFHFLIRAGGTARLLQTAGGPDWPRVQQIEMTGEYPVAALRFRDAGLPVEVELTAFSPFAPLDARFSSMPLAAFVFRITNPTKQKQSVSLAALMQNPVGYDAAGPNNSGANACFAGNVNEVLREGEAGGLFMRAEAGSEPKLDTPVTLYTAANLAALREPPPDRPKNLTVEVLEKQPLSVDKLGDPAHTVIWLEDAAADISEPQVRAARCSGRAGPCRCWRLTGRGRAASRSARPARGRTLCSRTSSTATIIGRLRARRLGRSRPRAPCQISSRLAASSARG
jgi:hypothetical protein